MQNVHFTPPQLARMYGVNVSTIKRWVDRGMLGSDVTAGGHRRVRQSQLDAFLRAYPKLALSSYVLQRLQRQPVVSATTWQRYYRYLERGEVQNAENFIQKLFVARVPVVVLLDEVIVPSLRHIGDAWAAGMITVFEEHRMSFIVRRQLLRLDQYIPETRTLRSPLAVLACAPAEHHEIPLQMLDLVCKVTGWRTAILGINVPLAEMERAVTSTKATLLGVTSTYTHRSAARWLKRLVLFTKRNHVALTIGGGGWQQTLRAERGVTYCASLRTFETYVQTLRRKTGQNRP